MKSQTKTIVRTTEKTEQKSNVLLITTKKLIELLMEQKGATFVTFTHRANMSKTNKMRKGNNPHFGNCFKTQSVNGMINFHYDKGVLRRLEKEGKSPENFKKGKSWHEPVLRTDNTLTPFARHKKDPRRIYVRFMYLATVKSYYHTAQGSRIATDKITPFLPSKNSYKNQGLEKPLIFNTWGIDDIIAITLDNQKYSIKN